MKRRGITSSITKGNSSELFEDSGFTPFDIDSLYLLIDPQNRNCVDGNFGDEVTTVKDLSNTADPVVSGTVKPTLERNERGLRFLRFDGVDSLLTRTLTVPAEHSVVALFKTRQATPNGTIIDSGGSGNRYINEGANDTLIVSRIGGGTNYTYAYYNAENLNSLAERSRNLAMMRSGTNDPRLYVNKKSGEPLIGTPVSQASYRIGAGVAPSDLDLYFLAAFSSELTDEQIENLRDYAIKRQVRRIIRVDGDSISTAVALPTTDSLDSLLAAQYANTDTEVTSGAIGGQTTAQIISGSDDNIGAIAKTKIMIVNGGTNDQNADEPAATIHANLRTIWQNARDDDFFVIACTVHDKSDWTTAQKENIDALNDLIVQDTDRYNALVRLDQIFDPRDEDDFIDQVHLSNQGMGKFFNAVMEVIPRN